MMGLYGLPEGAFESVLNNKDSVGIVVVWETTSRYSARPGRRQRQRQCVSACTPAIMLELRPVSSYL